MIAKPIALSGTYDLTTITGGIFFTNVYYGEIPEIISLTVLSGESNFVNAIEFQKSSTFTSGSLIIGTSSPSGIYQVYDFENREIIFSQEVENDNVEDFS